MDRSPQPRSFDAQCPSGKRHRLLQANCGERGTVAHGTTPIFADISGVRNVSTVWADAGSVSCNDATSGNTN